MSLLLRGGKSGDGMLVPIPQVTTLLFIYTIV